MTSLENLRIEYRKEKNGDVRMRMLGVLFVKVDKKSADEAADLLRCSGNSVRRWVSRFEEAGSDGLRDLPRSGRPHKVSDAIIEEILEGRNAVTPKELSHEIYGVTGTRYDIGTIRRRLRLLGMSAKTLQVVHVRRPNIWKIRSWQRRTKEVVSRLKRQGYTIAVQDESIFTFDPIRQKKYWSPIGVPVITEYSGSHKKAIVYGVLTADGRRFFRTYNEFKAETFLAYLQDLKNHFGKTCVIMDKATQHTAKMVREYAERERGLRIIYLPTGTPDLSAIEAYWLQAKRDILISEYYGTFLAMRQKLSEYLRTHKSDLNVMNYIERRSIKFQNF